MRLAFVFPLLSILLLTSCHYNTEDKAKKVAQLKKQDDAATYNIQLGMGYLKQGDTPRAKRKLLTALELTPSSPDAHSAMAYYLEKTGDLPEAKKYYDKALVLAPNSGSQLNNYGTFLCRTGQYDEAEVYFLKAVKDVNYINTASVYENAGLCAAAIPNEKKAEAYFLKALQQDGRRKQSLFELVSLKLKQNQPLTALDYLQKYQEVTLSDPSLLAMGIDAAHQTNKADIEADYKVRMSSLNYSGAKNEYTNSNG